jgi:MFS transporter, PAT family, beta-lactamase induction signal transducer AmpG
MMVLVASTSRARRLGALGGLYVAQGIVYGFGGLILVPSLAAAGVALEAQAGILALAGLPWVLKLAWAPLLDRFGGIGSGRARWWAAAAMLGMAASLAALASRESLTAEPVTVAWLWLVLNVALSLQDVSTDALVLDLVPAKERGLTNGVLLGGHHLGAEGVGGLGLGLLVASQGLGAALWGQAAIMVGLAVLPLMLPRPPRGGEGEPEPRSRGPALRDTVVQLLHSPRALAVAGLAAVIMSANVVLSTISGQFWVQRLGWSVEDLSTKLAPLLLVVNLAAYAGTTFAVDRLGHWRSAMLGSAALGLAWVGFGLVPGLWGSTPFVVGFVVLEASATAALYVGLHAALMDATLPALRATHFAVLMALLNLPRAVVAPAAPTVLDALGYAGLFMAAGAFQVAMAGALRRLAGSRPNPPTDG